MPLSVMGPAVDRPVVIHFTQDEWNLVSTAFFGNLEWLRYCEDHPDRFREGAKTKFFSKKIAEHLAFIPKLNAVLTAFSSS